MLFHLLALILGTITGTITGLTPGIHTNLITAALITTSFATTANPTHTIIFITSLAITHTFVDFIPSTYFSAPEEDTAINTLAGHKFLKNRQGHTAVSLTLVGSILGVISLLIISPLFIVIIPKIYPILEKIIAPLLLIISITLILKEKQSIVWAIIIFLLAGTLGVVSTSANITQPLLPLLTGLFGSATIIHSIKTNPTIPKQKTISPKIKKHLLRKPLLSTTLISPLCSLLPGIGTAQAATISSVFFKKTTSKEYLILTGSINTLVVATSFLTLYLIQKTRTGAAIAINQIVNITPKTIIIIYLTIIITTIPASIITILTSKQIAKHIHRINYSKISITILLILIIATTLISGFFGLAILVTATILGLLCIQTQIRKTHLMGAILIPTIFYYLPI